MKKKLVSQKYEFRVNYFADDCGHVWSEYKQGYVSEHKDKDGYLKVRLMTTDKPSGKGHLFSVHRLILENFNPVLNMENLQVDHIDGDRTNNQLSNLRWTTCAENIRNENTLPHHRSHNQQGENNLHSKLNNTKVLQIIKLLQSKKYSQVEIARIYDVAPDTIGKIYRKETWRHLTNNINFS